MSRQTPVPLSHGDRDLEGVLVSRRDGATRPGVLIFPTVMGVTDLELGYARQLVELGFTGLVADLYGKRFRGAGRELVRPEMDRLRADRAGLRSLLLGWLKRARSLGAIDRDRIVAIGFCFGGQCALDLARSGADIAGVASFHGLLDPPDLPREAIGAKVLVFHGWDDPLAEPDAVLALGRELTEGGADWQLLALGGVGHAFTNPAADGSTPGLKHDALAAERSWTAFINFLEELSG